VNKNLSAALFPVVAVACIVGTGLLLYGQTLHAPFFFDDYGNILENAAIRNVFNLFPMWQKCATRIIPYYTFALNYHIGRLDPSGYHMINLAVHLATSTLVFVFVRLLFETPRMKSEARPLWSDGEAFGVAEGLALGAAMLFMAHPVQTQAVTYIVQRMTSLSTMFYLASVVAYIEYRLRQTPRYHLLAFLFAVAAMFSKETSFTLPFALVLIETMFFGFPRTKEQWKGLLPLLGTLVIIPAFLVYGLSHDRGLSGLTMETVSISRLHYLFTQINVVRTYLRLLVWPVPQNVDYDYPVTDSVFDAGTGLSLLLIAGLFGLAWRCRGKHPLAAFGIFWFFLTLSIESSIIPIRDVIQEHRLYLPLAGLSITLCYAVFELCRGRRRFAVAMAIFLGTLSFLTYQRNMTWRTETGMWEDVIRKSPHKSRAYSNLGSCYVRQGEYEKARELLVRSNELEPSFEAYVNLGAIDLKLQQYDEAVRNFQKALEIDPRSAAAYNNLGVVYKDTGNFGLAEEMFHKALANHPQQVEARDNLAIIYRKQDRLEEAEQLYREILSIDPNKRSAVRNLLQLYLLTGKRSQALTLGKMILEKEKGPVLLTDAGSILASSNYLDLARALYTRALAVDPHYKEAYLEMGKLLGNQDKFDQAIAVWKEGARIAPDEPAFAELIRQARALQADIAP